MPPARLVILLAAVALLVSTSQNTVALPTLFDADPPLCSHQGVTCESDQVVAVQLGRQNRWPTEMSWGRCAPPRRLSAHATRWRECTKATVVAAAGAVSIV